MRAGIGMLSTKKTNHLEKADIRPSAGDRSSYHHFQGVAPK